MASKRIPAVLEVEESPSGGPTFRVGRCHCPNPQNEPGQSSMGRTPNPRGTVETRVQAVASNSCQIHGPAPKAALPNVAHLPAKPYKGHRRCRFLRGSNGFLRPVVC